MLDLDTERSVAMPLFVFAFLHPCERQGSAAGSAGLLGLTNGPLVLQARYVAGYTPRRRFADVAQW